MMGRPTDEFYFFSTLLANSTHDRSRVVVLQGFSRY